MKLNERIICCRKKCGLSQEELGEKVGVSRQAVSKWETGDALPEVTKLKTLADVFGVTVDYLLNEDDLPEEATSNPTADNSQDNDFDVRENIGSSGSSQSTLGIHSTGSETSSRVSLFAERYAWIGGVALIVYGVYRTIAGLIGLFNIFGIFGMINVGSIVTTGAIAFFSCGINIAIGVLLIIAGKYVLKKYKPTTVNDKKLNRVSGRIMIICGVAVSLIGAIIACNAFGGLDIIRLIPRNIKTPVGLMIAAAVLICAIMLIVLGSRRLKKAKNASFISSEVEADN